MLDKAIISELKNLVSESRLEEAFFCIRDHLNPLPNDLIALEGRYQQIKRNYDLGFIEFKEFTQFSNRCNAGFLSILKDFEFRFESPKVASSIKFNPHHQLTCDRSNQYGKFVSLLNTSDRSRCHFFYLFGGEAQAHRGIFQRCVNRMKGLDLDHLSIQRRSGFEVVDFAVTVPCMEDISCLGTELSRMLLAEMDITDKMMEQISDKCLAFGLASSPKLTHIVQDDKIFFHFSITEAVWNKEKVPELARDFIENFCLKSLPPDSPELFFFFSVEYDDDNEKIRDEIATALETASFLKNLGELKMVTEQHIDQWFTFYKDFWETSSERKDAKRRHFGDKTPDMFMEDVQLKLQKVIKEVNHNEKYDKRN